LVRIGDAADADKLADVDGPPGDRTRMLGMLGAAYAKAQDPGGVARAVAQINAVKQDTPVTGQRDPRDNALAEIGVALAEGGAADGAVALAAKMADGYYKVNVLSHAAFARCANGKTGGDDAAAKMAGVVASDLSPDTNPVARTSSLFAAAAALAACDGSEAARRFLTDNLTGQGTGQALGQTVRVLTAAGQVSAAIALAPPPNPADPEDLLQAALLFQRAGDLQRARHLGLQASAAAVKGQTDSSQPHVRPDRIQLLSRISSLLTDIGAYDEALETVQPIDPINRRQFYRRVLSTEAERHDGPAIDRTLPGVMKVILEPTPAPYMVRNDLSDLVLTLAHTGFRKQAKVPFDAIATAPSPPSLPLADPTLARYAAAQAAMGDLPGALKTASAAGPLVAQRSGAEKNVMALMALALSARSKEDLVSPQALAMRQRMASSFPTIHPGPQASALVAIATELASEGDVAGALQAEAGLEKVPGNDLDGPRDTALAAIAAEQIQAGQPEAALETTLRIRQDVSRLAPLLKLAALPVHP
jgi:hypothetical protein